MKIKRITPRDIKDRDGCCIMAGYDWGDRPFTLGATHITYSDAKRLQAWLKRVLKYHKRRHK